MAQKKTRQLDPQSARSVAQKARRSSELREISQLANDNLLATEAWKVLHPEHLQAIKYRLLGGDTLGNICRALGIERTSVCNYIFDNPEYARQVLDFKAFGSHMLYERLIEMIDDKQMSANDKLFAYKVISNYAPKINRAVYGDALQVDQNMTLNIQIPTGAFGTTIDAEVLSVDRDPDPLPEDLLLGVDIREPREPQS